MPEPNALDLIFNAVVSDREVKKMVHKKAKTLIEEALVFRLPESTARLEIATQLTEWIQSKGLNGRGTKKLVDKAVSRAMRGYCRSLHKLDSGEDFNWFRDTPSKLIGSWADRALDQLGSSWRRNPSVWVGKRVADAFGRKQK